MALTPALGWIPHLRRDSKISPHDHQLAESEFELHEIISVPIDDTSQDRAAAEQKSPGKRKAWEPQSSPSTGRSNSDHINSLRSFSLVDNQSQASTVSLSTARSDTTANTTSSLQAAEKAVSTTFAVRKRKKGYDARVTTGTGRVLYLGRFKTEADAESAVKEMLVKLHEESQDPLKHKKRTRSTFKPQGKDVK